MRSHFLFCLIIFSFLFSSCSVKKDVISFEAMNTFMTVQTYGKDAKQANQALKNRINEIENLLSVTKEESDIYKINNSKKSFISVDKQTCSLLNFALDMAQKTEGAFNPCLYIITSLWGFTTGEYKIPSEELIKQSLLHTDYRNILFQDNGVIKNDLELQLDLGAIGKGFAGDEAIKVLQSMGIKSALLDLGGNVQAFGVKPDGSLWRIGVKNPWDGSAALGLSIANKAIITSGGYERFFVGDDGKEYIHIFDSSTGHPVENNIASVTIICDSGLYADALSTSLFVMGLDKAIEFWRNAGDFDFIIMTEDKRLYYSSGLEGNLNVLFDFSDEFLIK